MKRKYIQPSIQVVMLSEATSVMFETSVGVGDDIADDYLPPADAKKHWGSHFDLWDDYSNEQPEESVW